MIFFQPQVHDKKTSVFQIYKLTYISQTYNLEYESRIKFYIPFPCMWTAPIYFNRTSKSTGSVVKINVFKTELKWNIMLSSSTPLKYSLLLWLFHLNLVHAFWAIMPLSLLSFIHFLKVRSLRCITRKLVLPFFTISRYLAPHKNMVLSVFINVKIVASKLSSKIRFRFLSTSTMHGY